MALIECQECGKEISDMAEKCPNCGAPINTINSSNIQQHHVYVEKHKGYWSTGRLTISIISFLLFFVIGFQSCTASFVEAFEGTAGTSGSSGMCLASNMVIGGIIGLITKDSNSKIGPSIAAVFYLFGGIVGFVGAGIFKDLIVWSTLMLLFGIVFVITAIKTKH